MITQLVLKLTKLVSRIANRSNPLFICSLFLILSVSISGFGVSRAGTPSDTEEPTATKRHFPETGFTVQFAFLEFFNAYGGLDVFGYPITNEYVDPLTGVTVQYFENSRFEWWPESAPGQRVKLGLLGDETGLGSSAEPRQNGNVCWPSDVTGYFICDSFLDFYQSHGGKLVFGPPIGDSYISQGKKAQNFQRMQMVMDMQTGVVTISHLGRYSCENRYEGTTCEEFTTAVCGDYQAVLPLEIDPTLELTKTRPGDEQTVKALVLDSMQKPICGAAVRFTISVDAVGVDGIRPQPIVYEATTRINGLAEQSYTQWDAPKSAKMTVLVEVLYQGNVFTDTTQYSHWQK